MSTGSGGLSAAAAAAAVILTIVHGLLTRAGDSRTSGQWLSQSIQRALAETIILKSATVLVWIVTVSMTFLFWTVRVIEGSVVDASSQPVDKALVILKRGDIELRHTYTSNGVFRFARVPLWWGVPTLDVHWRGTQTHVSGALQLFSPNLRISLPPRAAPFRAMYFDIGGHAIDFLIRGEFDEKWEKRLGGQPYVVQNAVFTYLQQIVREYAIRFNELYFSIRDRSDIDTDLERLATQNMGRYFFVGGWSPPSGFDRSATYSDVHSLAEPGTLAWSSDIQQQPTLNAKHMFPVFMRYAIEEDLDSIADSTPSNYRSTAIRFYKHVTHRSFPANFAVVSMSYSYDGCADGWEWTLQPRVTRARVLVLENITGEPIEIGQLDLRRNEDVGIRTVDSDKAATTRLPILSETVLPLRSLRPSEKILIPISVMLLFETHDEKQHISDAEYQRRTVAERLRIMPPFELPPLKDGRTLLITGKRLAELALSYHGTLFDRQKYVIGPTLTPVAIDIDHIKYPVRQLDEDIFVLYSGSSIGSCPYIYTRTNLDRSWRRESHILYGLNRKDKESQDDLNLKRFNGSVLVREEDAETSHIDSLEIIEQDANGTTWSLFVPSPLLSTPVVALKGRADASCVSVPAVMWCGKLYRNIRTALCR